MKPVLTVLGLATLLYTPALAERYILEDTRIGAMRMYGRTFDTQAALLFVDKQPQECQALWLPTGSDQGGRSYLLALTALENGLKTLIEIETDSNIPNYAGNEGKACEILFLQVYAP